MRQKPIIENSVTAHSKTDFRYKFMILNAFVTLQGHEAGPGNI